MYFYIKRIWALTLILALLGCATTAPPRPNRLGLKLAPAALGESIAIQQHLKVERHGRIDELDAALEVDAHRFEFIGLAFGQRVLSLSFDGKELTTWRHPMLPSRLRAEDVLEDIQLTLWPIDAIRKALPIGWSVEDKGLRRILSKGDVVVTVIDYSDLPRWSGTVNLENLIYHYRLMIQSVPDDA